MKTTKNAKYDQEMDALLWVVGKLDLAIAEAGPIVIPVHPTAPYDSILAEYNRKVEDKMDYSALRQRIMNRIRYIIRRRRQGRKVWYERYFLHLLGKNRRGIQYGDEPEDLQPLPPMPLPLTPKKNLKRPSVEDMYEESLKKYKEINNDSEEIEE